MWVWKYKFVRQCFESSWCAGNNIGDHQLPRPVGLAVLYSVSTRSKRQVVRSPMLPPQAGISCDEALEFPVSAEASVGGKNGSSAMHCFHGSSRRSLALSEELNFKGGNSFNRYLLLKNNFPARIYCECISLFLLFNVYFTLNLPGKILNKQIWIYYGIFQQPYVICVLIVESPVTLTG